MKVCAMKIVSVILTLWYCLSIMGFDVHTCHRSGDSFVAPLISGIGCADIHPEHSCHECEHHSEHGDCCDGISVQKCCTDDIQVLNVTGTFLKDTDAGFSGFCQPCFVYAADMSFSAASVFSVSWHHPKIPEQGFMCPDILSMNSIRRI